MLANNNLARRATVLGLVLGSTGGILPDIRGWVGVGDLVVDKYRACSNMPDRENNLKESSKDIEPKLIIFYYIYAFMDKYHQTAG